PSPLAPALDAQAWRWRISGNPEAPRPWPPGRLHSEKPPSRDALVSFRLGATSGMRRGRRPAMGGRPAQDLATAVLGSAAADQGWASRIYR
ncbi:unnamed protein product, partial [Urochloa humidicola]